MGHGGWTDSICSQLCVALVMDGELERPGECGNEGDGETAGEDREEDRKQREKEAKTPNFLSFFRHFLVKTQSVSVEECYQFK